MRSSSREYLAPVDHLRFLAAALVVLYHGCQLLSAPVKYGSPFHTRRDWLYSRNPFATTVFEGHTGVALFMVLSGFIFTVGSAGKQIRYGNFMRSRLLRIFPLYLVIAVMGEATHRGQGTFDSLLRIVEISPAAGTYGGIFWTIRVELEFYLVFPMLNRLLTGHGPKAVVRLVVAVATLRALVWMSCTTPIDSNDMLYSSIAGRIDQFLLGMLAAWLYLNHRDRVRGWWKVGSAVSLAVGALWVFNQLHAFNSDSMFKLLWVDIEGSMWALVVMTYVATCTARGLPARVLAKAGECSYSVYLIHFMVISAIVQRHWWLPVQLGPVRSALATTVIVVFPAVLVTATLTYRIIEKPFLALRTSYLTPAQSTSTDRAVIEPRTARNPTGLTTAAERR